KIHRKNCSNLARMASAARERIVDASWPGESSGLFVAGVSVSGMDRPGILTELTHAISNYQNTNIRSVSAEVRDAIFESRIIIYVKDKEHLDRLIDKLKKIVGVTRVDRMSAGSTTGQGQNV
ncbi:MAG TPA: RelA/SpoT family protein, partial [Candidatus Kryptobacter bacterium]|nr:RelA/SpoT family protein [Candidatus Kryptobacter bacterium]